MREREREGERERERERDTGMRHRALSLPVGAVGDEVSL